MVCSALVSVDGISTREVAFMGCKVVMFGDYIIWWHVSGFLLLLLEADDLPRAVR